MLHFSVDQVDKDTLLNSLGEANLAFQEIYPGDKPDRQAVHTVYGGANLFKSDTTQKIGDVALKNFRENAPDFTVLPRLLKWEGYHEMPTTPEGIMQLESYINSMSVDEKLQHPGGLAKIVYDRIIKKLATEGVEDFRIDFEDGFGNRPDEEEDATAINAATELAEGMKNNTISPFIGIRIKPFTEDLKVRGVRTLDIFLTTLLEKTGGKLPGNFVVMLPKVTIPEQVKTLVRLFEIIEHQHKLPKGSLKMETMVEATQIIMDEEGRNPLMRIIKASEGRCIAAHFGTYDYTASCGITARYQTMAHPVCDFAHHVTKVALGGTGIFLSDGATNVMPIGPHRGDNLSGKEKSENMVAVHRGWKIAYDHTMHSLINGLYQGWDLNPAQVPMRYAATYYFFLSSMQEATNRLRIFVDRAAISTLTGDIFDDAATGQGLLNFFLKALNCGAITEEEAMATGLSLEEIHSRSFYTILKNRRSHAAGTQA